MRFHLLTRWRTKGNLRVRPFNFASVLTLVAVTFSLALAADDPPKRRISQATDALEIWTEMSRSSLTFEPIEFQISPTAGAVSFGGEKEGGDALITRIMGPSVDDFDMILKSLRPDKRREFLAELLNGLARERYQVSEPVLNGRGEPVALPTLPEVKQYGRMSLEELEPIYRDWISQTQDRPFSFLTPKVKVAIFDGDFAGMSGVDWIDRAMKVYPRVFDASRATDPVPTHFNQWKPNFGDAENYISRMVTELLGDWELNFKPQTTYGEFEKMMHWFRDALKDEEGLYNAFGHQWVVVPKREISAAAMKKIMRRNLGEVYKVSQALIVLRGMEMNSGILTSMYNEVRADQLIQKHELERSVVRLKNNLFPTNTGAPALNIEQRSGTSYNPTRRIVQQAIVSRYVADDWDGLADATSYDLIPENSEDLVKDLPKRFGVTPFEAKRCLERISSIRFEGDEEVVQGLRLSSLAPFWNWDDAPFLSKPKKELLKKITRNFIQQVAAVSSSNNDATELKILEEFAKWAAITDIDTDIENYLKPKPKLIEKAPFGHIVSKIRNPRVNVNEFDFGIEYTTRFPIRASSTFTENDLKMGKRGFLQLEYDMTPDEKRKVIYEIAKNLGTKLNGRPIEPKRVDAEGHGHKIAITYEVTTPEGQVWRVEWDGIGRDYDLDGNILTGSERGGVVEIVTPKYNPAGKDVAALYQVFKEMGVHPSFMAGGGHINFDLAVFDKKPKELARFIAIFLENRDVLTTMFQHPGRFTTAEPQEVSQRFLEKLRNFDGTEEDLKKLLYNEQFFNTRLGRKTKYVQLELSSYFQDVIPPEFITKDFDIKGDVWRRQFRVNPKIRKGEFRLFGAPRSYEEAGLQLKIVRAMMHKALNDDTPLDGTLIDIDPDKLVADPASAFARFEKSMSSLGLNQKEYAFLYGEGLQNTRYYVDSAFYEPYETKMKQFPKTDGWKKAVKARAAEKALTSKDRIYGGKEFDQAAIDLKEKKDAVKRQVEWARNDQDMIEKVAGKKTLPQSWREYDEATVAKLKRLPWTKLREYPEIAIDYLYEHYGRSGYSTDIEELQHLYPEKLIQIVRRPGKRLAKRVHVPNENSFNRRVLAMARKFNDPSDLSRLVFYARIIKTDVPKPRLGAKRADAEYWDRDAIDGVAEIVARVLRDGDDRVIQELYRVILPPPFGFKLAAKLLSSVVFRQKTYAIPGKKFETAWGDFLANSVEKSAAFKKGQLHPLFGFGNAIKRLIVKNEDVTFGSKEWELISKISAMMDQFANARFFGTRGGLDADLPKTSLAQIMSRRCYKLLMKN